MLRVDGISSYYGKACALSDVSFDVPKGKVVALLGRNGAGKTTCLKSIMQLLTPKTGSVHFEDDNLLGLRPFEVARRGMGYVPEERRIFTDLTVLENLEVGRLKRDRPGMAPPWEIDRLFDLFPNLKERQNNRGKELSGGEQQMLTLARTLMGNPVLILLDEPSEGIAPVIVEQMAAAIDHLKSEGQTMLISEQNLRFAKLVADFAIVIESGVVRFSDTWDAFENAPSIAQEYLSV